MISLTSFHLLHQIAPHNMKTLHVLCDRAALLDGGTLTMYESVKEAEKAYTA